MLMMPHNPRGVCGVPRGRRLSQGEGPVRVDLRPRAASRRRHRQACAAPSARRSGSSRGRCACRSSRARVERLRAVYCGAWEQNWGFVAADGGRVPPARHRAEADFRSALRGVRRGRRPPRRLRGRRSGHQSGAERHRRPAVSARSDPAASAQALRRPGPAAAARRSQPDYRAIGLYPLLIFELHRQLKDTPYRRAEFSWVLEDNRDINQPAERRGAPLQDLSHLPEGAGVSLMRSP